LIADLVRELVVIARSAFPWHLRFRQGKCATKRHLHRTQVQVSPNRGLGIASQKPVLSEAEGTLAMTFISAAARVDAVAFPRRAPYPRRRPHSH
jgi:hypothetical protein